MNWGKSIILAFVIFAAFMGTLVTICFRQDISLVTTDYYREELAYQGHIDRLSNTNALRDEPEIRADSGKLIVSIGNLSRVDSGYVQLFRPSDPALDIRFVIPPGAGSSLYFPLVGLKKGMYRARMEWTMAGRGFSYEQVVYF